MHLPEETPFQQGDLKHLTPNYGGMPLSSVVSFSLTSALMLFSGVNARSFLPKLAPPADTFQRNLTEKAIFTTGEFSLR